MNSTPETYARPRALVMRVGALGDVLLTRRLTFSLSLSGLRTTVFAPARHALLLRADPWIDGVLDSESPKFAEAFEGHWPGEAGAFDAALVISNSAGLAGAAREPAKLVIRIPPAPEESTVSVALQWSEAARELCTPFTGSLPVLPFDPDCAVAKGLVLIHPGSGSPRKNWPKARFMELARRLAQAGHRVVWVLGPAEADQAGEGWGSESLDRPSLEVLAATLGSARLFVGNDSGVSHLAAAVGAPTLAIFGPTDPLVWTPDGTQVRTVFAPNGRLGDLSVEAVEGAAVEIARI